MRFLILLTFISAMLFAVGEEGKKEAHTRDSVGSRAAKILQQKANKEAMTEEEDEFEDLDEFDDEFAISDQEQEEVFDPLIGYNRWMTGINHYLMLNLVEPSVSSYNYIVPEGGRESVNNVFKNLYAPVSVANNALQLEVVDCGTEIARFLINSTIGLLGLFDPAEAWFELKPQVEDFGQTLGYYGVGSGFPIVVPFFGQRNLRDLAGTTVDAIVDPIYYMENRGYNVVNQDQWWASIGLAGYENFNEYSLTPGAYEKLTEDAVDLYPFLRDAYEQHRNQLIKE